jgi:hypothetical protein
MTAGFDRVWLSLSAILAIGSRSKKLRLRE